MSDIPTIFIVDDSESDRLLCNRYIQKNFGNNYHILETDCMYKAIEIWRSQKPDVTLIDFNLRDGNGLKFLEAIQELIFTDQTINSDRILYSKLPVIMLTGSGDERIAVNAMKLGAFDYLVKDDITQFSLCQCIQNLLEHVDITSKLKQSQNRATLVAQMSLNIRQFLNLEDICRTVTQEIRQFLKADRTLIYKFNQDMSRRIVAEEILAPWQSCFNAVSEENCINLSEQSERAYRAGQVLATSDIYQANFAECHLKMLESFQVQANVVVPILLSESVSNTHHSIKQPLWGLLIVHQCSNRRNWKDDEIQLLKQLSVQLAIAIQQAEIYQKLQSLNNSLEHQVQERTSALQLSEQKSRSMLTALPDIINLIRADGIYLESKQNSPIYNLFPPNTDPIGKHIMELLPVKIATRQLQAIQRAVSTQEIQTFEQNFEVDNRTIYEEVRVAPVHADTAIVVVRDISDRKYMEIALQNSLQREKMVNHFIQTIRSSLDLQFVFKAATDAIANLLNLEQVTIVQYIPEQKIWKHIAVFRDSPEIFNTINLEIPDEDNLFAERLKNMEIVQITKASEIEDEVNRKIAEKASGAWLLIPIIVNNQTWGSLSSRKSPKLNDHNFWVSHEVEVSQAIANQLGIAIQQITLYQQLQLELVERKKTEIALAKAKELAEAANKAKSEFLANMSHEIRTPMNGVLGMTQLLATTPLRSDQKKFVQIILDSGDALLTVINDILDLSKIESGKLQLEAKEFNFTDILNSACNLLSQQAFDKNIDLQYHVNHNIPNTVIGDSSRLRQIFINLIGNAIKFTDKGHISISVNGKFITPIIYEFQFAITDSGIGIDSDRINTLFTPFTQADASINRQFGGTGLGLAICKRLVELMNGTIWVESRGAIGGNPPPEWLMSSSYQNREGSTFYLTISLPVIQANYLISQSNTFYPPEADINPHKLPIKILIVEDNILNQKITYLMLKKLGYEANIVENGQECVMALSNNGKTEYELIFMDLQMPVMDGLTATKIIRQNSSSQTNPWIVALTADALINEQQACIDAGMNDFISKPISIKEIVRALSKYSYSRNLSDNLGYELVRNDTKTVIYGQ